MRLKRPFALSLTVIAALLLLAVAVLWLGVRTAAARRAAGEYLGGLTGLPVTVDSLAVGFLPAPSLDLGGLVITPPPGFGADPLVEVGSASVTVAWRTVFGGDPMLRSVFISDVAVRPALAADGADNWSGLIERLSELGGEGPSRWSIEQLAIERGAIEFHDMATGSRWRLTAITVGAEVIAPATEFPIELQLAGVSGGNTFHLALQGRGLVDPDAGRYAARDLALRGWAGGDPLPLAGIELEGGIGVASFDGETSVAEVADGTMTLAGIRGEFDLQAGTRDGETRLDCSLTTAPFSPRVAATAFGSPLPATADPLAFQTMQFAAQGHLEQGRFSLHPITGRLDDTEFSGQVIPQLRMIRIRADRIDIDRYLAPDQETKGDRKATLEAAIAQLGKLDIDAEIRIAEARVAGAKLRDALLKIERNDGTTP